MSWQTILKLSYSSKNLSMLKQGIEKVYATIPSGTVFKSRDYYEQFVEAVKPHVGKSGMEIRGWLQFTRGKGLPWFTNYFTNYGLNREYIKREGSGKNAKLTRL
tara:strand:+ start:135 stop:446 length:312 start_codon:yes stop_codon:yes gene_type:complete